MNHPALPLVALGSGMVLIVSSYAWLGVRGGANSNWTEADEEAFAAAMLDTMGHSHSDEPVPAASAQEESLAHDEFQRQQQKFQRAANRGRTTSWILWVAGVSALVAGAVIAIVQRATDESA